MTLYYDTISTSSRVVYSTIKAAGIDVELSTVSLMAGANKAEDYVKLNPNGKIPLYKEGDFVLFESFAIIRYLLDTKAPDNTLYPRDTKTRARFNQLLG
jgi:glutathione S-transferase